MDALPESWIWLAGAALVGLLLVGLVLRMVKLFVKIAVVVAVALAVVWAIETYGSADRPTGPSPPAGFP